ncbi:hypothetical protein PCC8801_0981 [Rippkaea orientalis PCC 8801]|uniref:Uncharacterized protein n=1 Tax=Rippkaea orientalis (strain PCC 8801 / RF-1) TaxID=41431 RepID=B7JZW4_RIPO1|nr:hypothetical protein [Rippkaea orientalis]ACK65057.1 hypothetical protein PCC8801_0981 [Rippkaea orientalis PCC 8801]
MGNAHQKAANADVKIIVGNAHPTDIVRLIMPTYLQSKIANNLGYTLTAFFCPFDTQRPNIKSACKIRIT